MSSFFKLGLFFNININQIKATHNTFRSYLSSFNNKLSFTPPSFQSSNPISKYQTRTMSSPAVNKLEVTIVPVLDDNYSYILYDPKTKEVAVVDPVEPKKILSTLKETYSDYNLKAILTTHHHWDHAGGNDELVSLYPDLIVYGGDDRINALNKKVKHDETFKIGSVEVKCLHTPGHTTGHICFYFPNQSTPSVFTGDTLFVGGSGRFFEGTPKDMYGSLIETLSKLPPQTLVYCGHEYTASNYKFALLAEPENQKLKDVAKQASSEKCTIPSTIQQELDTNPFMRVTNENLQAFHGLTGDPIKLMGYFRQWKNEGSKPNL